MSFKQKLCVVSYFFPGTRWDQLLALGSIQDLSIINPASGPGYLPTHLPGGSTYVAYSTQVDKAVAGGHTVLGYETTNYMDTRGIQGDGIRRDPANIGNVLGEIDTYYSRYNKVGGIFFDEMENSGSVAALAYYKRIWDHMQTKPGRHFVFQNPGASFTESYMPYADLFMSFEGTWESYKTYTPKSWMLKYGPERFCHVVHGCPADQMENAVKRGRENRAGYFVCTDDVMSNPYDKLPTYLTLLAAEIDKQNLLAHPPVVEPEPIIVAPEPAVVVEPEPVPTPIVVAEPTAPEIVKDLTPSKVVIICLGLIALIALIAVVVSSVG